MINKIKIDQRLRERTDESSLAISLYSESGDKNGDTLTERNAMFLSLQIFIDTILRMKQVPKKTKKELLDYLRNIYRDNDEQLRLIGEFERDYSPDRAIWWYTRSTFLYRVLNQALRCHDFDILIAFRFFISDLYKQLSKEHEKYLRAMKEPTIQVYRGQGINENELNLIRENVGEFISMNSFLSTTTNRDTAVFYAESNAAATDSVKPILFEFNIDQELMGAIPFASIRHLSYFQEEDEVLISLGNIFRIIEIKNTEENIWIAKLKLCSKTNFSLNEIFEYEMRDMPETPTLITLSRLLMQAGEYEKAKSVIQQIISESQNDLEKQNCYGLLGNIAVSQGDYDLALDNYLKCLEFQPEGDDGDSTFHWMKHIFELTGQHYCPELKSNLTLGLSKGALQLIPEDHEFSAVYYQNMGLSYSEKAEYDLALECFNKALNVQDKTLPEDHRDIGRIYSYTGNVYEEMEDYQMALKYYNESLRIYRKTLPPTHEDIQSSEENVKRMQEKM
jgi:tetratricopeptide (TPR) repeat protein